MVRSGGEVFLLQLVSRATLNEGHCGPQAKIGTGGSSNKPHRGPRFRQNSKDLPHPRFSLTHRQDQESKTRLRLYGKITPRKVRSSTSPTIETQRKHLPASSLISEFENRTTKQLHRRPNLGWDDALKRASTISSCSRSRNQDLPTACQGHGCGSPINVSGPTFEAYSKAERHFALLKATINCLINLDIGTKVPVLVFSQEYLSIDIRWYYGLNRFL